MLKVKTITLLDGSLIEDIDMLPGLGSYFILKENGSILEIPRERVASIEYSEKRTVELVKGLTLVPIVDELDTLEELYDDYESLNALMAEVHQEEEEELMPDKGAATSGSSSPLTKNPYSE